MQRSEIPDQQPSCQVAPTPRSKAALADTSRSDATISMASAEGRPDAMKAQAPCPAERSSPEDKYGYLAWRFFRYPASSARAAGAQNNDSAAHAPTTAATRGDATIRNQGILNI